MCHRTICQQPQDMHYFQEHMDHSPEQVVGLVMKISLIKYFKTGVLSQIQLETSKFKSWKLLKYRIIIMYY